VPKRLEDYVAGLPAEVRALLEVRTAALAAEVAAHEGLRRALRQAASEAAARLKTTPAGLEKIERRVDAYVAALREAVAAAGGSLEIVVRLPDRPAIAIAQFEGVLGSGGDPESKEGPTTEAQRHRED
jgi:hypothetical protein